MANGIGRNPEAARRQPENHNVCKGSQPDQTASTLGAIRHGRYAFLSALRRAETSTSLRASWPNGSRSASAKRLSSRAGPTRAATWPRRRPSQQLGHGSGRPCSRRRHWVLSTEGGPPVSPTVATNVLAALTGSASGGMTIALEARTWTLSQPFILVFVDGPRAPAVARRDCREHRTSRVD